MRTVYAGIEGQVILVVGAAGDLGQCIADELSTSGAVVVRSDRRLPDNGARPGEDFLTCDVVAREQVDELVEQVVDRHGRLDAVVVAAGVTVREPALEVDMHNWDHVLAVNLTGAFHVAQASARAMVPIGGGKIVLVGSWVGRYPSRDLMAYCVSKAGLDMLCRCLALELAEHRVRVNLVAPGVIDAGVSAQVFKEVPERREALRNAVPLGRLGESSDVAASVAFLLSNAAAYVTGSTLVVDGGIRLVSG